MTQMVTLMSVAERPGCHGRPPNVQRGIMTTSVGGVDTDGSTPGLAGQAGVIGQGWAEHQGYGPLRKDSSVT